MSVIPSDIRRSTRVERRGFVYYFDVGLMVAGGDAAVIDADPATGHATTPGTSLSNSVYQDDFSIFGNKAEFRVGSLAQADTQNYQVRSRYQNYLRVYSDLENVLTHAQSEGFARAERDFEASEDFCEVSGTCSVDSTGLVGASIRLPEDNAVIGLKMIARAVWGSGESYIQAQWEHSEDRWRVDYQYFYLDGTTTKYWPRSTYYVDGFTGLNHATDRINWGYILPYQGNDLRAEAHANKWGWTDNWWKHTIQNAGSRYVISESGKVTPAKEGFVQHEAKTVVDAVYQQRTFPANPRQ